MAMDAKLMLSLSTGHGDSHHLKSPSKQDAMAMVIATTSHNDASAARPSPGSMNPLLLASACCGSWRGLKFLFNIENTLGQPLMMPTPEFLHLLEGDTSGRRIHTDGFLPVPQAYVGGGVGQLESPVVPLLEGVTVEGDTVLHAVASHGDGLNFLRCAEFICGKARHLLFAPNNNGDTPLHYAVRAGKSKMSCLIGFATTGASSSSTLVNFLRKVNDRNETALHDAVRTGNKHVVELLLKNDQELARFPEEGSSPLYLAILLEKNVIARTLYGMGNYNLSYAGVNGQNALHAAVLRGPALTKDLLERNNGLTIQRDVNGSTPLHFAATRLGNWWRPSVVCSQVLDANPSALYQSDHEGLYPIHIAASVGAKGTIAMFLEKCPNSAFLRDAKGRTFLHVAVENRQVGLVHYACQNQSLMQILNMQDNDGNTALHLAVQSGSIVMFYALFGNCQVELNVTNGKGRTPLDISKYKITQGFYYTQSSEENIHFALTTAGARSCATGQDHFHEFKSDNESIEIEKVKDTTQTLAIASVLIATVTFGATFALPGGYKADDHTNGGTPTLAGRYTFDAFMMANTLALASSVIATFGLMRSGSPLFKPRNRKFYLGIAFHFMETSLACLFAAFALGVYLVLGPVAHKTATAICVISSVVVLCNKVECWIKWSLLAWPLFLRMGLINGLSKAAIRFFVHLSTEFWPFLFIFGWPAYAKYNHQNHY
ncbi:unnamed protein product [Urochloa decumbens]|uniref:PGG domain-containing protein n=1 Tax=Urochloa decumbens TaxID=240449 RepID=A0ABC9BYK9_9POAL